MATVSTLRIRHTFNKTFPLNDFLGPTSPNIDQEGFCIEGWVKFAPMDNRARLFLKDNYEGAPLRLEPGIYPKLAFEQFPDADEEEGDIKAIPSVRSIDLPEGVEAVFFSETNFRGKVYPYRDDIPNVTLNKRKVGSVLILDRRHREQSHVVLFEKEMTNITSYNGKGQVLQIPQSWTPNFKDANDLPSDVPDHHYHILDKVGSAWLPPGIALDIIGIQDDVTQNANTIEEPTSKMSFTVLNAPENRQTQVRAWYEDAPNFTTVDIPEGLVLFLFEKDWFEGKYRVLTGKHDEVKKNQWAPNSAVLAAAPDGTEGVLVFKPFPQVYPEGSTLSSWTPDGDKDTPEVWLPTEFALMQSNTDEILETINTGFFRRSENVAAKVVRLKRMTLRGDLNNLPAFTKMLKITARRSTSLKGNKMAYVYTDGGIEKQKEIGTKYWQSNVPEFKSVRVPEKMALFLWSEEKGRGDFQIIVGGKDDFDDLTISEIKSAALVDTPNGVEGIVYLRDGNSHAKKVFKTEEVIQDDGLSYLFIPPGYRLVPEGGDASLGEIANNPDHSLNVKGYRVEQYVGLFSNNGNGLAVKRSRGMLRAGSDELRFGGKILQPNRWYHLAYNWASDEASGKGKVGYFVNGKKVASIKKMDIEEFRGKVADGEWVIGNQLRGSLADIRVWKEHKGPVRIQAERYTELNVAPFKKVFSDFSTITSPPNAIELKVELPSPPGETRMVKNIMRELEVQRALEIQEAEKKAVQIKILAEKRMVHRLAQAREKARQLEHLKNMDNIAFARGKDILVKDGTESTSGKPLALKALSGSKNQYALDVSIFRSATEQLYFIADSWNNAIVLSKVDADGVTLSPYCTISKDKHPEGYASRTPQAIVSDASGDHPDANGRKGIYWIEEDGAIYRYWDDKSEVETSETGQVVKLVDALATGRARNWDMVFYNDEENNKQWLIWCNGFELFQVDVKTATGTNKIDRSNIEILVPHAISPHPVVVAADPDGNLVWLDAKEEMVRTLKQGEKIPLDLYAAPNPNRGLSICQIVGSSDTNPVTYIYWVSGLRRTVEVPILDTPGRYIDLWQNPDKPLPHGQHVPMVAVDSEEEIEWQNRNEVFKLPFCETRVEVPMTEDFVIQMKMKVNEIPHRNFYLFTPRGGFDCEISFSQISISGSGLASFTLPQGEWLDLEIKYEILKKNKSWGRYYRQIEAKMSIVIDGEEKAQVPIIINEFNYGWVRENDKTSVELLRNETLTMPDVFGELAELRITNLEQDKEILYINPSKQSGKCMLRPNFFRYWGKHRNTYYTLEGAKGDLKKTIEILPPSFGMLPSWSIINFADDTDGMLKFEPIRVDFKKGWTVAAELIWDGSTSTNPVCVYELATFENEDRIVCAILDGRPVLYIYWNGKQILGPKENRDRREITERVLHHVSWVYDPKGEVMMYVDGKLATKAYVSWNNKPVVWEHHSLGAPNPNQLDQHVKNASIREEYTNPIIFESFNGQLSRFGAWNSFEPNAKSNWEQSSDYDPTWDRSLVTYESRRRYLHAGRLDGSEPPVTLFPLDMDGALNITSVLDSEKAAYTLAQAELVAAEAYAVKLKEDTLKKALDDLASAEKNLEATKVRTQKELADEEDRKCRSITAARRDKSQAIKNLETKKQQSNRQADKQRKEGRKDAERIKNSAENDKRNRVADATQRRNDKRDERDIKKKEAREKGLV